MKSGFGGTDTLACVPNISVHNHTIVIFYFLQLYTLHPHRKRRILIVAAIDVQKKIVWVKCEKSWRAF